MNCFEHDKTEAVGVCKICKKGICRDCAADSGIGIACKGKCTDKLKYNNRGRLRGAVLALAVSTLCLMQGFLDHESLFFKYFIVPFGGIYLAMAVMNFRVWLKYYRPRRAGSS